MTYTETTDNGSKRKQADPAVRQEVELVSHFDGPEFVAIDGKGKRVLVTLTDDDAGMARAALKAFVKPTRTRLAIHAQVSPNQIETY